MENNINNSALAESNSDRPDVALGERKCCSRIMEGVTSEKNAMGMKMAKRKKGRNYVVSLLKIRCVLCPFLCAGIRGDRAGTEKRKY